MELNFFRNNKVLRTNFFAFREVDKSKYLNIRNQSNENLSGVFRDKDRNASDV